MSLEEFGGGEISWENISYWNESNENQEWPKEKISQADIARVEAQAKKAKQVWAQWQQYKKNNQAIAKFLTFLFQKIQEDKIIFGMYGLFFTKTNPNTWAKELKSTLYAVVLIWMFVPFFLDDVKQMWLRPTFEWLLWWVDKDTTTSKYIAYIERLCQRYKISFIEHTSQFIFFVIDMLFYFWIVDEKSLDKEQKEQLFKSVQQELFNDASEHSHHNHIHRHTHDKEKEDKN